LQSNLLKMEISQDKTTTMNHEIFLKNNGEAVKLDSFFEHSTNGQKADFETAVSLQSDEKFLHVNFICEQDQFVGQNNMTIHNDPLYNQEVFEVFLSPGHQDSKHYLEIEINPNNAIWVGTINNPTLGAETQTLEGMIVHAEAGIIHEVTKLKDSWRGKISIPWSLIDKNSEGRYRINFYRIRANKSHENPNWVCDTETCDFVCWKSSLSGESPAFHRPKRFGFLTIQ
jgi:sporulation protein YlmC with PRC-barrel domain